MTFEATLTSLKKCYTTCWGYSLLNKTKSLDDELEFMKTVRDLQKATEVKNIGY